MVGHEDIVLAVLGAAAGLGGFILVFLTLWVSTLQSFPPGTETRVLNAFRLAAYETVAAFLLGVLSVGSCVNWLANGQGGLSYGLAIWSFMLLLVLLVIAVAVVVLKLVRSK